MYNKKEAQEFMDYIFEFYGKDEGIYRRVFNNELTKENIKSFFPRYINFRNEKKDEGGGFASDSFDREILRDIMLVELGYVDKAEVETAGIYRWLGLPHPAE